MILKKRIKRLLSIANRRNSGYIFKQNSVFCFNLLCYFTSRRTWSGRCWSKLQWKRFQLRPGGGRLPPIRRSASSGSTSQPSRFPPPSFCGAPRSSPRSARRRSRWTGVGRLLWSSCPVGSSWTFPTCQSSSSSFLFLFLCFRRLQPSRR